MRNTSSIKYKNQNKVGIYSIDRGLQPSLTILSHRVAVQEKYIPFICSAATTMVVLKMSPLKDFINKAVKYLLKVTVVYVIY